MTDIHHNSGSTTMYAEDEISLYDLYRVLLKRKKIIILFVIAVLLGCTVYAFLAQRIYQVSAILLPPGSGDLYLTNMDVPKYINFNQQDNSNVRNQKLPQDSMYRQDYVEQYFRFKPKDIFSMFSQGIVSTSNWSMFVNQEKKYFPKVVISRIKHTPFTLGKDKDTPGENILVTYDTSDQANAAKIFEKYLQFVQQRLTQSLIGQVTNSVRHSMDVLTQKIKMERELAKQTRQNKIIQLKNELSIAKRLGITDNLYLNMAGKLKGDHASSLNIFTSNPSIPTYMRGTKALSAELSTLEDRKSDDAYISNLPKIQNLLSQLKQVVYTPQTFHAYRSISDVSDSLTKIKPRTKLIFLLGGVLGLFLGIFAAFIVEFISKANEVDSRAK